MKKLIVLTVFIIMAMAIYIPQSWAAAPTKEAIQKQLGELQFEINLLNTELRKWSTLSAHYQTIADVMREKAERVTLRGRQIQAKGEALNKQLQAIVQAEKAAKAKQPNVKPAAPTNEGGTAGTNQAAKE